MANDFTGRTLKITNTTTNIPLANFKVKGGLWTGGTAGDVFTLVDAAGRSYDITYPTNNDVTIPEWGWISGPASVTSIPHGEVLLFLGTK